MKGCIAGVGMTREDSGPAGMTAHPSMGMPGSPILEQLSAYSISTEIGQSDWRISPYETNPPSDAEEGGKQSLAGFLSRAGHTSKLLSQHRCLQVAQAAQRCSPELARVAAKIALYVGWPFPVLCLLTAPQQPTLSQAPSMSAQ